MNIYPIEHEIALEVEADPRFGDLAGRETGRYHGRARRIGGDKGDLLRPD